MHSLSLSDKLYSLSLPTQRQEKSKYFVWGNFNGNGLFGTRHINIWWLADTMNGWMFDIEINEENFLAKIKSNSHVMSPIVSSWSRKWVVDFRTHAPHYRFPFLHQFSISLDLAHLQRIAFHIHIFLYLIWIALRYLVTNKFDLNCLLTHPYSACVQFWW